MNKLNLKLILINFCDKYTELIHTKINKPYLKKTPHIRIQVLYLLNIKRPMFYY